MTKSCCTTLISKGTPGLKNLGDLLKLILKGVLVKYIVLSKAFSSCPVACSITLASITRRFPSGNQGILACVLSRSVDMTTSATPLRSYKKGIVLVMDLYVTHSIVCNSSNTSRTSSRLQTPGRVDQRLEFFNEL